MTRTGKSMKIETLVCGALEENAYIVTGPEEGVCAVIDPGDDEAALLRAVEGRKVDKILLTHGHYDHILGAGALMEKTGAPLYVGAGDMAMLGDEKLCLYDPGVSRARFSPLTATAYGDTVEAAGIVFRVCPTPGHTPGGVCLYAENEKVIFTGDTLFMGGYGRTDFPGGSFAQIRSSLRFLLSLPGETAFYPGHGQCGAIGANR